MCFLVFFWCFIISFVSFPHHSHRPQCIGILVTRRILTLGSCLPVVPLLAHTSPRTHKTSKVLETVFGQTATDDKHQLINNFSEPPCMCHLAGNGQCFRGGGALNRSKRFMFVGPHQISCYGVASSSLPPTRGERLASRACTPSFGQCWWREEGSPVQYMCCTCPDQPLALIEGKWRRGLLLVGGASLDCF